MLCVLLSNSSSHPSHCKRAAPFGIALRIKRNCFTDDFFFSNAEVLIINKNVEKKRPRTDPCGTPLETADQSEKLPQILTCLHSKRKLHIRPILLDDSPSAASLAKRRSSGRLSKVRVNKFKFDRIQSITIISKLH